jgi:hypothetical protein
LILGNSIAAHLARSVDLLDDHVALDDFDGSNMRLVVLEGDVAEQVATRYQLDLWT